jgi:hypothetical protein
LGNGTTGTNPSGTQSRAAVIQNAHRKYGIKDTGFFWNPEAHGNFSMWNAAVKQLPIPQNHSVQLDSQSFS